LVSEKRSSPHTVESYKSDLEQFSAYCNQQYECDDFREVSTSMIRSWMATMLESGYKSTSIHRKMSSVKAYYRFAQKNGLVISNPVKGITKPKKEQRLPHYVEEKSMMKLYEGDQSLNDFETFRNEMIIQLFYETGIRLSELMQLTDNDIDFSIGQIKVLGKRNKMRYVPVGKPILDRLKKYQALRDSSIDELERPMLIVNNKGQKISKTFVYQTVKSYLSTVTTQAKRSPHVLRHTFATHMLNNGADLNVIKEILGHSSLAATQVYTHNSIEKLKGIHKQMHPRNKSV
jgi:integrase/recombinase XerC